MLSPWILCGVLLVLLAALSIKYWLLKKVFDEIRVELIEIISKDTNTLITISSGDKYARRLAAELNTQLCFLREQRLRFQSGDRELKESITNISHDLRTPITAIRGYLDLLEQEEMSEAVRRYLSFIENRIEALRQLLDELFRYSVSILEPTDAILTDVCLNDTLELSVAEFYAALKARQITPLINMPNTKIIRTLDKTAVSRIFSNIINNALKYSDGDLEISLYETGEIVFSNTASALDEVQVGKLFNRFYTVNAARNSTGLGLAISQLLVERMGGQMNARYSDNKLSIIVSFICSAHTGACVKRKRF